MQDMGEKMEKEKIGLREKKSAETKDKIKRSAELLFKKTALKMSA